MNEKRVVLASTSVSRRDLLGRILSHFDAVAPQVDEVPISGESPADCALRLSILKAKAGAQKTDGDIYIGSDQVAECEGIWLSKPGNVQNALKQLALVSGKVARFHTGVCVFDRVTQTEHTASITTEVKFRVLTQDEIERYVSLEDVLACAGSAKSEGLGITLLESITGPDPTALIGLPLITLSSMLRRLGMSLP